MIRLAAFDIAGTTVDDRGAVYTALERAVTETGAQVAPTDLQKWMGAEKSEAIAALVTLGGGTASPELVAAQYARFKELLTAAYESTPPTPIAGVPEAIARLRASGVLVALTTGFAADIAQLVLARLGWQVGPNSGDMVDALVTADEVSAGRPAPYMIYRAMERTGVDDIAQVMVAGDTLVDVLAGARAGAALTFGVLTGKAEAALFAGQNCEVIDSVSAIPALLAERGLLPI